MRGGGREEESEGRGGGRKRGREKVAMKPGNWEEGREGEVGYVIAIHDAGNDPCRTGQTCSDI